MNNTELMDFFIDIDKIDNCFDKQIALKKANKLYKRSEYYKQTKHSINHAYIVFKTRGLDTISSFLTNPTIRHLLKGNIDLLRMDVEEFVGGFDFTKFDGMFAYLIEKADNLKSETLKNELTTIMKEFQDSLKS
jgi:hypothetical protein